MEEGILDSYLTVNGTAEGEYSEKRSKFYAFSFHVENTEQIKSIVADVQKKYYDARHVCYAYMLGPERLEWRVNDNGEPSGTAGKPILGQINSRGLTDVLVAVVRYFGGVKLGTSGLIEAYRQATVEVLNNAEIVTRYVEKNITIFFDYPVMNEVMKLVKEYSPAVVLQEYDSYLPPEGINRTQNFDCKIVLRSRLTTISAITAALDKILEPQVVPNLAYEQ
ncbi:MAG: YigZ family protein [Bacteroidaceae bacterium]|nr:YigZ family protein [Bacteroidaceae bacterium]MBO5933213.1 YigZ family protein [Bacteroidaceae bacterium]MBO5951248.1 YigZ family protein [Bacteroidaceae bacterium]